MNLVDLIPRAHLEHAAALHDEPSGDGSNRVCANGDCPIGAALRSWAGPRRSQTSALVGRGLNLEADRLCELMADLERGPVGSEAHEAMATFIALWENDWLDHADLPAAFGLEP